jgi:hypothetical protein
MPHVLSHPAFVFFSPPRDYVSLPPSELVSLSYNWATNFDALHVFSFLLNGWVGYD